MKINPMLQNLLMSAITMRLTQVFMEIDALEDHIELGPEHPSYKLKQHIDVLFRIQNGEIPLPPYDVLADVATDMLATQLPDEVML